MLNMTPVKQDYVCIKEDTIQNQSRKITELLTRADYKDQRLDELIREQKRMDDKLDHLLEVLNQINQASMEKDNEIDNRLNRVENTLDNLKWAIGLLFGTGVLWILLPYLH